MLRECKFVTYLGKLTTTDDDIHVVKEYVTEDDGSNRRVNLRVIKNFQRSFWITKPHLRNHKQKKESESMDRLNKFTSNQRNLHKAIATRLDDFKISRPKSLRDVSISPYVYGTDVDSRAIIKKMYLDKYPTAVTPYSVATLDIEIDIDTRELLLITVAFQNEIYVCIHKDFIKGRSNAIQELKYLYDKYIPKTELNKNMVPTFEVLDNELDIVKAAMNKLHTWKSDFVAIWNINFDIPYIVSICKKYGVDPKDIFSDPDIPEEYRYFEYKQGSNRRVTASGVPKLIPPEEQWHIVTTPSSFYWIDAMCCYWFVRVGGKKVPGGYSLDNILTKVLGSEFKKLKFEDTERGNVVGVDWHKYMTSNKPLEYIIYNVWDTISMLELDNKTKDLSVSINALCGISSFDIFNSGPKKIIDAIHFFYLDNERVLSTKAAPSFTDDEDEGSDLLGLSGWIMILDAEAMKDNKGYFIKEDPKATTNIRFATFDYDAVSSYPSNTRAANVSRDTTSRELMSIEGVSMDIAKLQNINLFFGYINSLSYCKNMFNFPTLQEIDKIMRNENQS